MTVEDLIRHMDSSLFVGSLKATRKDAVLQELTDALVAASKIKDRELILEMLRNREQLGSTAMAPGIAFPHGRSLAVQRLTVLVARSPKGVEFDSQDGKPTRLFFMLVAPPQDSGNLYLQALGTLTGLIQKADVRSALMEADSFEAITTILREAVA